MQKTTQFNLTAYLNHQRERIDNELNQLLTAPSPERPIMAAMRYTLMAGGKRLRPILCIAAAEAIGGDCPAAVLPAACALEMIHTYSLIHDDLPAMDNDPVRRGKPTCHKAFDEATAILAGDALLTMAFETLAAPGDATVAPAVRLAAIQVIARAAGYSHMIEGQMQDIHSEGRALAIDELKALHAHKTSALIRAAIDTGALFAGASPTERTALGEYADCIGLAFQITDDILNVTGDPVRMGKAVGTDAARGKNTYPALLGLDAARAMAAELVTRALLALEPLDGHATPLRAIAKYIIDRNR